MYKDVQVTRFDFTLEHRARALGAVQPRRQGGPQGDGHHDPWRRGHVRTGRRLRVVHALRPALVHDARHDARRHQQPDRVHHRPTLLALVSLLHGRGARHQRAHLPRERRRARSRRERLAHRRGVAPRLEQRRRDRPRRLPALRTQRDGRHAHTYFTAVVFILLTFL